MLQKLLNWLKGRKGGFTLIEVVIVLAIAGLIFVIVFLAVSQAQASRRDTQRKADLNRIGAALEQFASNNNGVLPTGTQFTAASGGPWYNPYWTNLAFQDPSSGSDYVRTTTATTCGTTNIGTVQYTLTGRTYSIKMCLERGENTVTNQ